MCWFVFGPYWIKNCLLHYSANDNIGVDSLETSKVPYIMLEGF